MSTVGVFTLIVLWYESWHMGLYTYAWASALLVYTLIG
jgi:hypothetical protein